MLSRLVTIILYWVILQNLMHSELLFNFWILISFFFFPFGIYYVVTTLVIILTGQQMQESICNHQRKFLKLKQRKQKVVQRMKKDLKNKRSKLKRKGKKGLRRKMDRQHHQRRGNPKRENKRLDVLCILHSVHS